MDEEWIIATFTVLYAIIGMFIVTDAYFDFKLSFSVREFFRNKNK